MNITVDKNSLLRSISIADSIISAKQIHTVLSNCLFKVSNDDIEIISTDNEVAVRTHIDAISDYAGSFTVNGKKFAGILKELPDDEVILNVDESMQIEITSKSSDLKGHYTLIGMNADDFPEVPEISLENSNQIDQAILKEMIRKVLYAASTDIIKPVFNSLYITSEEPGSLTAVATDSRRLSCISRKIGQEIELSDGLLIPHKTVNEIMRLLESSGTCQFSFNKNQFFIRIGVTEIISRMVEGQFPNFRQVIPVEHSMEAIIDRNRLYNSIKRAMVFTREPANKVVLTFSKNKLLIQASTPELGNAEEELPVETDSNESLTVGLNAQFLVDTLREITSPAVKCCITGTMSPVTISPEDDESYTSVIMPIQLKSSHSE